MKKIGLIILTIAFALSGCTSNTTITETTFNPDGTVAQTKVTETNESAIVVLAEKGMANNLAVKQGGWYANIGVNAQTQNYGINAGAVDNSLIMGQNSENGTNFAATIPAAWEAQKYKLEIGKDGVKAEGDPSVTTSE